MPAVVTKPEISGCFVLVATGLFHVENDIPLFPLFFPLFVSIYLAIFLLLHHVYFSRLSRNKSYCSHLIPSSRNFLLQFRYISIDIVLISSEPHTNLVIIITILKQLHRSINDKNRCVLCVYIFRLYL